MLYVMCVDINAIRQMHMLYVMCRCTCYTSCNVCGDVNAIRHDCYTSCVYMQLYVMCVYAHSIRHVCRCKSCVYVMCVDVNAIRHVCRCKYSTSWLQMPMLYVMCVYAHAIRHVCRCKCYTSWLWMPMLYVMCADAHAIRHVFRYTCYMPYE